MHRGVQEFINWLEKHPGFPNVKLGGPAQAADLAVVESQIAAPLPADLRFMLQRHNGGTLPSGQLLRAGGGGEDTIEAVLRELASQLDRPLTDSELLVPFFRTDDGGILAFDRSAGPVADTWPIVDYQNDNEALRLVYRTFDGFCRVAVAEWTAEDFDAEFTLQKYLNKGERHAAIEPDVSIAHGTVAHARRRAGDPEGAMRGYLAAARCVPSQPWCDWEALKIAVLLGDAKNAMEAANRLSSRAPRSRWVARETTPVRVADVLGVLAPKVDARDVLARWFDQLAGQCETDADRTHVAAVRRAVLANNPLPQTTPIRPTAVPPQADQNAWWNEMRAAYGDGRLRDDDLLLDPAYQPLRASHDFAELLRIRREF